MVMLVIAISSIWKYQGHVRYARESKMCLFYLYAAAKREIQTCSNKHETGLVLKDFKNASPRLNPLFHKP